MRSQLRLRVILPVAVLGLLGLGVGAFAMGGPPEGASSSLTAATTTSTTTAKPAPAPPPQTAWAEGANTLCARANREIRGVGEPNQANVDEVIASSEKVVEIATRWHRAFVALGWPKGEKAAVERVWAIYSAELKILTEMVEALKARQLLTVLRLSERLDATSHRTMMRILKRLGADTCTKDAFAAADPERGLAGALQENKVVVVLFYAPGSTYDAIQGREARAGAGAAGAGFLAVDVSKDRYVASLATAFDVRDAPAILVIKRGYRVAFRLDGFADRETVAQAAANAQA
jgi:hypothetical protein